MFEHFKARHIPPLFIACAMAFGGLMPIFNPEGALVEFGFPEYFADDPLTFPVMVSQSVRTTAVGLIMLVFYAQNKLAEIDTVMAVGCTYIGVMDCYVLWSDRQGMALFRLICGLAIGAWGFAGLTRGRRRHY
ncbi:uncharacterized protein GGS25DRAFT_290766 [Hypoxylon fragiforme]|uniref:uncharacterized protein n=1 Tax=Hypoxylon fragiforme TaxID=63214 RepID=UPI0020C7216A|nr:uncharacterized protein GGS25DRAFT_290766 [Hypoxylon fragiforme]KAI2608788.1 hypothetical protein GGS25DRAFT_290766 [Hypoxylon fragiforme]